MTTLPRVTEILQACGLGPDLSRIPEDVLNSARDRGIAVHAAVEALTYNYLDEDSLAPEVAPYISAYRKFVAESGYEAKYAEIEVVNERWGYRGHPDSIGWLLGHRALLDLKSGGAEGVQWQLCGYREAWNAQHPTEPIDAIHALLLRRDGTYRLAEYSAADATPVWYAAVTVFKAQRRS